MTHRNMGPFLTVCQSERQLFKKKCTVSDNLLGFCSVLWLHVSKFQRNISASVFSMTVHVRVEGIWRRKCQ